MTAPIIVTALFGAGDFAILDALRRAHFPPERNVLRAHLTMFHHLPPSVVGEVSGLLQDEARGNDPRARLASLINLGGGVAFRLESPELEDIRARIADRFASMLMPQDRNPWRPHVTVQNKVKPPEARALLDALSVDFRPRALELAGLAAFYYRGGPWEPIAAYAFGTGRKIMAPA
ncbi:2'-5' RNA ligase family protein [Sphingomonas sp.]|uniref:2'-5' RNA ligase family protein n=1 Tax=Sphingomonas sp. TaxID=28214 RepID=UPI0025E83A05|nr:2'-5' RNA ligase family protein [Sphingomonas sp.]